MTFEKGEVRIVYDDKSKHINVEDAKTSELICAIDRETNTFDMENMSLFYTTYADIEAGLVQLRDMLNEIRDMVGGIALIMS